MNIMYAFKCLRAFESQWQPNDMCSQKFHLAPDCVVLKVERKSDKKIYALKRVNISKMSKREVQDAVNEIRILASVRHPHIVSFLQAFLDKGDTELCIIMEYCGCGDLAQKVDRYKKRKQQVDERVIWAYLIQVTLLPLSDVIDNLVQRLDVLVACFLVLTQLLV